jgi:mannose-6-phosphate isomerase
MTIENYGGIPVKRLDEASPAEAGRTRTVTLGQNPYQYAWVQLVPGDAHILAGPAHYCVYVLDAGGGSVTLNGLTAHVDEYALGDAASLRIEAGATPARLLVASQNVDKVASPLKVATVTSAKRVEKPWGHEIWLTGDPSRVFAFKRILLRAGHKTSLQFHRYKRETNFICAGRVALHYNPDQTVPADHFVASSTASVILSAPCVADVFPGLVHRLEAIEDLLLYEVSTPELDDVIRLADDAGRSSGRVATEHTKAH